MPLPFRRIALTLAAAAAIGCLLLLPDLLFLKRGPGALVNYRPLELAAVFGLGLLLCLARPGVALAVTLLLALLQLSQVAHLVYFGQYLQPNSVRLMVNELSEITESALGVWRHVWTVPLAILLCFGASALMLRAGRRHFLRVPYVATAALIGVLLVPGAQVHFRADKLFYSPRADKPLLVNALYTYFLTVQAAAAADAPRESLKPYTVTAKPVPDRTVVVIMGESLGTQHLGLFGYPKTTTPRLSAEGGPGFRALPALAAGVATRSTMPLFFNLIREPTNRAAFSPSRTNLFRLAGDQGFATAYLSAQSLGLMQGVDLAGVQRVRGVDSWDSLYEEARDEGLLTLLDDQPLGARNFLVLHLRTNHSAYDTNYRRRPELAMWPATGSLDAMRVATYDNSIRYTDHVVASLVEKLRQRVPGPLYILFTADHSELMGENGLWGHSMLDLEAARVPFLVWGPAEDAAFWQAIDAMKRPSHHEIGLLTAGLLGQEVHNPNAEPNVFYMNGPIAFGEGGYIKWRRDGDAVTEIERVAAAAR